MDPPRASQMLQTTSRPICSSAEAYFRYGSSSMARGSSQYPYSLSLVSASSQKLSKPCVSRPVTSSSCQTPPSSPSTSPPTVWDVFISFRGVDTRNKFTDHLYEALDRYNIRTFKDDPELRSGEVISDTLLQAIHESKTYIVVFSENYASSRWCLDELVEIHNCHQTMQKPIFVVYYNIDPSVVRYQTKSYKKAFQKHETRSKTKRKAGQTSNLSANMESVKKWRLTLAEVAGLSGKHIYAERSEAAVIKEIIFELLLQINPKALSVATYPVGLDSRVGDITAMLSNHTEGVIKIGIYGMGGVGKTTLAKALYNQLLRQRSFNGSCFLANIREVSGTINGLVTLQQQLINDVLRSRNVVEVHNVYQGTTLIEARICSTKVLVVIDDLDDLKQFSSLVRPFASGSVVIITTRDEEILDRIGVEPRYRYMVNELDDVESSALFNQHAFGNSQPSNTLMVLSEHILSLAGGLPLALEVFGSYLYNRSKIGWESFIEKLQRSPDSNIQQRLKISLDALESDDPMLKKIFLDIACFFVGRQKDEVVKIMETYYSHADYKIDILRRRCLLTINNEDALRMHDLLRDMGKEIARNTFPEEPGKHSRLWVSNDICNVLRKQKGTEAIEGIIPANFDYRVSLEGASFATEAFKRMSKLRFLYLDQVKLTGSFELTLENLRWLCWDRCPLKCLPFEFYPQKLVTLELPRSKIRTMWELNMEDTVPQVFEYLKNLNMSSSLNLTTTPDFAKSPCLETINLKGCESLEEIHVSIGSLISLVSLNLNGCVNLKSLQDSICNLRLLRSLNIGGCSCIEALPSKLGNMKSLKELNAEGLTVSRLPDSIGHLSNLVELRLSFNRNIETLPNTICNLKALEILHIVDCSGLKALPKELGNIESLKELNAQGLHVSMLPKSIGRLKKLVKMTLSFNKNIKTLPNTIGDLRALESLNIGGCSSLEALPLELGNIKSLKVLHAEGLTLRKLPDSVGSLSNLVELTLSNNDNLESLPDTICNLSSLEILDLSCCKKLDIFPHQLWKLTRLRELYARGATLFKKLFDIKSSSQIAYISLHKLDLTGSFITALPSGISHLSNLEYLDLIDCGHMLSIAELPPSLKWIRAAGCTSMESLPDISNLKKLERLDITDCSSLNEIQGLEELTSINILGLGGCNSSLMAYTFTKRIFQIYSEFGHHIRIYTRVAEFPDWTFQSSNFGSTMSLDLPPNVSRDYLAMILCFTLHGNNDLNICTYSVKNTTSGFIWNYSFLSHYYESLMVILPRSIFSVRDGDQRIEITSNSEICGSHLLYRADVTGMDEYNSSTFIAEDNRTCPSKRSKHLEK